MKLKKMRVTSFYKNGVRYRDIITPLDHYEVESLKSFKIEIEANIKEVQSFSGVRYGFVDDYYYVITLHSENGPIESYIHDKTK